MDRRERARQQAVDLETAGLAAGDGAETAGSAGVDQTETAGSEARGRSEMLRTIIQAGPRQLGPLASVLAGTFI